MLKSELFVLAKVEPAPPLPKADPNVINVRFSLFGESPARLRPISVLLGTPPDGLIEVHFDPNIICPSPPRFPERTNVLAFLRKSRNGKGYETVALSYGAKTVSDEEATAYSQRITEWLDLERRHPNGIPTNAVVEWLVKCVEMRATESEGAHELVDQRPLLGTNILRSPFAPHLNTQQLLRLSNVVFRSEYITSGGLALLGLFEDKSRKQVVLHVFGCLTRASTPIPPIGTPYKDCDGLPEPWNTFDAMWLLADLLDNPDVQAFVKRFNRTDFFSWENRVKQLKSFLPIVEAAAIKKGYLGDAPRGVQQRN